MKRIICFCGCLLMISVFLAGCGNAIPEMDEAAEEMVVEYAVSIVKKYDQNYTGKLKTLAEQTEDEMAENDLQEENLSAPVEEKELMETSNENSSLQPDPNVAINDNTESQATAAASSIEACLNLDAVSFNYEGYEITDFYPSQETETYFMMNSTEGNDLLVLKFTVQNLAQTETLLDMISTGVRFKIIVNGETKNALTTMLLNDIASYQGTLEAGGSTELVAVCEIPEDSAGAIESLSIIVKNEDATTTISLY